MKRTLARQWIGLLVLMSGPVTASAQFNAGGSRPPGPPPGPPPVAIDACNQQAAGSSCEFVGRRGEQVTGTCVVFPRLLACLPDAAPPPPRDAGDDSDR